MSKDKLGKYLKYVSQNKELISLIYKELLKAKEKEQKSDRKTGNK